MRGQQKTYMWAAVHASAGAQKRTGRPGDAKVAAVDIKKFCTSARPNGSPPPGRCSSCCIDNSTSIRPPRPPSLNRPAQALTWYKRRNTSGYTSSERWSCGCSAWKSHDRRVCRSDTIEGSPLANVGRSSAPYISIRSARSPSPPNASLARCSACACGRGVRVCVVPSSHWRSIGRT